MDFGTTTRSIGSIQGIIRDGLSTSPLFWEKEAVTAARTDEQISTLLGKEQAEHYPIILQAQGMLSTLNALKDRMDTEKLQANERDQAENKLKWAEEDRKFLLEERQRKSLEDKEDREFLLQERARKAREEEDDRRRKDSS